MNKILMRFITLFVGIVLLVLPTTDALAKKETNIRQKNSVTGYELIIEDDAHLLNEQEEQELSDIMEDITVHGNVIFKSISVNNSSTSKYASSYYKNKFGSESGTIFLIDMDNRYIYIFSDGAIYKIVDEDTANIITDNIYSKASSGDFFNCASAAFRQINAVLNGESIAKPMKYISNFLMAACLALLVNFVGMLFLTKVKKVKNKELISVVDRNFHCSLPKVEHEFQTKSYSPQAKGSGSGGGGGGSSSGGGGGHSF